MPVSPLAVSPTATAFNPALGLGAASLNSSLSAPSAAPAPLSLTPLAASAVTPAAAPVAVALSAPVSAAASEDAPRPAAPRAAAPVVKKTWTQRFSSLIGRKPSAPAPTSESLKAGTDGMFDGSIEKAGEAEGPSVAATASPSRASGLKSWLSSKVATRKTSAVAGRVATRDAFGGPLSQPMSFAQRVGYGLKQGLNLVGVGALLNLFRPLLDLLPWPQYLSDSTLSGFGRVALLAKYGPNEIVAGLVQSPSAFLGKVLPLAVTMEEITYRLFGFGLTFLTLAAIKPLARKIASFVEGLPNAAGAVSSVKRALTVSGWISRFAFPIAAAASSTAFAFAHVAAWGFSPFVLALNAVLGLMLAHTAYKSRSLTSPILAHLLFNLVAIGGVLVMMSVSPFAGAAFAVIAGLIGASSLLYTWLSARKERAFRLKFGSRAVAALLIAGLSLPLINGTMNAPVNSPAAVSTIIQQVQDRKTESAVTAPAAVIAPAADTAAVESREEMVARVKGSVVNVIVRMPQGTATGSGFILTPDGVFITNGHVVGSRQPGELIEARVPGVPGLIAAKVLAVNHDKDLAIVQLAPRKDGQPWPTVKLASRAPREGEAVTATGYPRGLPFTVSAGVVSGLDGRGNMYVRHLQTDAAINPGNSGGPLFNARGEVVGVNTQIYTQSGGSEGLGFSIMAPEVARVMAQFAHTGNIATASLGIIANLSDPTAPEAGLEIEHIRPGSPADKAGLQRGDLLIGIRGDMIMEGGQQAAGHVAAVLSKMIPGQKVTVVVLRGDSPVEIEVTVGAKATTAPQH